MTNHAADPLHPSPSNPLRISTSLLFQTFQERLKWHWLAAQNVSELHCDALKLPFQTSSGSNLVGYLNSTRPHFVSVLGEAEIGLLNKATKKQLALHHQNIQKQQPLLLIVADNQVLPPSLLQMADEANIPLFAAQESSAVVIDALRAYFSRRFAPTENMHGVFLDILGLGVLITGESGIGKSELGLELISRGNSLVADDVVDLYRINHECIEGRCPELLQNLLEVRGIGLLNICALFGETAVRSNKRLQLIVHLTRNAGANEHYERLPTQALYQDVLGMPIRKVIIEVRTGRNLAVLVEAAVRNTLLEQRGINTYEEFTARLQKAMAENKA